jgi:hypothetical protein
VVLVAGTRLVNMQASGATLLLLDLLWPQIEPTGKLRRASAIYINKISMNLSDHLLRFWLLNWSQPVGDPPLRLQPGRLTEGRRSQICILPVEKEWLGYR